MHSENDDDNEGVRWSPAEQKKRRREAYLKAKAERAQDPEYQALLAAEKLRQRAEYEQAKALKQAADQEARRQQKLATEAQRAAVRQAKLEALAKLIRPASQLNSDERSDQRNADTNQQEA